MPKGRDEKDTVRQQTYPVQPPPHKKTAGIRCKLDGYSVLRWDHTQVEEEVVVEANTSLLKFLKYR